MADKKINVNVNVNVAMLALLIMLVFGGIIYFAWSTKPADTTTNSTTGTEQDSANTSAAEAEVDKLGSREVKLTPENFANVTTKNKLVLVDMYAPTCPHCQKIAPILTELSNEYADKLVVAKMSTAVDANRDFILNWDKNFQYVPAITIFKDGQKVESFTGEKTKEELQALINKYLN